MAVVTVSFLVMVDNLFRHGDTENVKDKNQWVCEEMIAIKSGSDRLSSARMELGVPLCLCGEVAVKLAKPKLNQ